MSEAIMSDVRHALMTFGMERAAEDEERNAFDGEIWRGGDLHFQQRTDGEMTIKGGGKNWFAYTGPALSGELLMKLLHEVTEGA